MKNLTLVTLIALTTIVIACNKTDDEATSAIQLYSIEGKVQKGPFITGTTIILNELNSNLGQTGRSFTSNITSDDGSFTLNNIYLGSSMVLLTANGFYFSELYGKLSPATLSLQSLSDVSQANQVNINVLTHLIKGRIEKLVSEGMTFAQAKQQSQSEFLDFLGITEPFNAGFDDLDISTSGEYNAVLLAFSVILQRYTNILNVYPSLTAELTQLLSGIAADFTPDGQINGQKLIDTLMYNISGHNLIDIRKNIEARYASLGQSDTIPDFEKYVTIFQEKYNQNLTTQFIYPDSASPDPITAPNSLIRNLLRKTDTLYPAYNQMPLCIAAITPLHSSLTIKFTGTNYVFGGPNYGWKVTSNYPNGFTLESQKENQLMTLLFHLNHPGNATIEYYENNGSEPTFTKKIRWF